MFKFTAALMLAAGASATSLTSSAAFTGRSRSEEPEVDPELLKAIEDMHAVIDLNDDHVVTVGELSEALFRF